MYKMKNIVGILLNNNMEYYYVENIDLKPGMTVIIENNKIQNFGKVKTKIHPIDSNKLKKELGKLIQALFSSILVQNILFYCF